MIALKTLAKEIAIPQNIGKSPGGGIPNEKILNEIIQMFVVMKENYSMAAKHNPETVKRVRAFLKDIARVFEMHGI